MTDAAAEAETDDIPLPAPRANRPVTLAHRAEYGLALALLGFFRLIGIDAASSLAGRFLRLVGPMIRPLARRAEDNLTHAYPHWGADQIRTVTKEVFENLGRTAAEYAHLSALDPGRARPRVVVRGADPARTIAAGGQPVIFVSAHMANWEVLAIALRREGIDAAIVYRAANNPLVDALIIRLRGNVMTRRQIPKGKRGGRALIDALRSGASLAMLVDQKLNDGIPSMFFGREAMTAPAAARLSLKYGAPIFPAAVVRRRGAHFDVFVRAPIAVVRSGDGALDVARLTRQINEALEREIGANPGQWLWLHRRWPKS